MPLAKSGQIKNCCLPNALLTFEEYLKDYADDELRLMGQKMIDREISPCRMRRQRARAVAYLRRIREGESDLRF